ncbi:MAG: methyltransferase [Bacteroidota bacterium]|nr:methyltransferase [Bacteroidota bacterium]
MRKLKTTELNRLSTDEFKTAEKFPVVVVLENIRSAMNIGSVFRTCDSFLIEGIYLVGISATPPNRDIQKSALGATETVSWKYFDTIENCFITLRTAHYEILAVEQSNNSVYLNDFIPDKKKKYALVFGNEVDGVSEYAFQNSDACLEIPQFGMKHSLNISVAAGIVLWEVVRKMMNDKQPSFPT